MVLVHELVEDVEVGVADEEGESVGELVGSSVGKDGSPSGSNVMDGMFDENPKEASMSAGGGGKIPGPVTPGMMMPPPSPRGGQNQQFNLGMMGHPWESCVAVDTPIVVEAETVLQSIVMIGGAVVLEGGGVESVVTPPDAVVDVAMSVEEGIMLELPDVLLIWFEPEDETSDVSVVDELAEEPMGVEMSVAFAEEVLLLIMVLTEALIDAELADELLEMGLLDVAPLSGWGVGVGTLVVVNVETPELGVVTMAESVALLAGTDELRLETLLLEKGALLVGIELENAMFLSARSAIGTPRG